MPAALFLVTTCSDGASHEAPEIHGPFADEEARTLAGARLYVSFFESPDPADWNEEGEDDWDLYAWRLDGLKVGACVTHAEATAALVKAGDVPADDAGNPEYPETGDADEGEHD